MFDFLDPKRDKSAQTPQEKRGFSKKSKRMCPLNNSSYFEADYLVRVETKQRKLTMPVP